MSGLAIGTRVQISSMNSRNSSKREIDCLNPRAYDTLPENLALPTIKAVEISDMAFMPRG